MQFFLTILTLATTIMGSPIDTSSTPSLDVRTSSRTCTTGELYCGYQLLDGSYGYQSNTIMQDAMKFRDMDPNHRWDSLFWCGNDGTLVAVYDCQDWAGPAGKTGACHPPNNFGSTDHCQPGGQ